MRKLRFFLVGPGPVGASLALNWVRRGHRCVGVEGRRSAPIRRARRLLMRGRTPARGRSESAEFDLLVVATPDRAIASVARLWSGRAAWAGRAAIHTSGALPASELEPLRRRGASVASLHPLTSLADVTADPKAFEGVSFGVEGDALAVRWAERLARDAGGRPFRVPTEAKAFYHLCACLSSGHLLGLLEQAAEDLAAAGLPLRQARAGLFGLAGTTLRNAQNRGPADALTGPVLRGDLLTIRTHLRPFPRPNPRRRWGRPPISRRLPAPSRAWRQPPRSKSNLLPKSSQTRSFSSMATSKWPGTTRRSRWQPPPPPPTPLPRSPRRSWRLAPPSPWPVRRHRDRKANPAGPKRAAGHRPALRHRLRNQLPGREPVPTSPRRPS